ncbi:MAG: PatB family C-S lyase [Rikenellaceae bacterium]
MKYNFSDSVDRAGSSAIKTDPAAVKRSLGLNYYPDTISMWVADMDFVCAPEILEALNSRVKMATFGYSAISDRYYETFAAWCGSRMGMQFDRQQVLYSNGTLSALRNVIRAFTAEGDGVIIQPPVYYPFSAITRECHRQVVENHLILGDDNRYSIDFDDFERKCMDPRNKLFILCNPHNPIGQIWPTEDVEAMLDICRRNGVLLFSDEVHSDLVRGGESFTSTLKLDSSQGVIVATAANKTFNLAGLHITNLIIPDADVRKKLEDYRGETAITPFAHDAHIAAYGQCCEWVDELKSVLDENINYMDNFIRCHMPKVRFNPPQGTYLTWLDFRAYGLSEQALLELCSEKAHVILEGGTMFSQHAEGFVRVNIACPKNVLIEALDRLKLLFGE